MARTDREVRKLGVNRPAVYCFLVLLLLYCERMCAGPLPWGLPLPSLAAKQKKRKALLLRLSQVFAMTVVTVLVNISQPLSHAALFHLFVLHVSASSLIFPCLRFFAEFAL